MTVLRSQVIIKSNTKIGWLAAIVIEAQWAFLAVAHGICSVSDENA